MLSVIFLQWLLLYERRHPESDNEAPTLQRSESSVDIIDDARPPSPEIVLPSITVVPPSPDPGNVNSDYDDKVDATPTDSSPATATPASDDVNKDDVAEILPTPASAHSTRRSSEASAAVLQLINEQRRFSVSATSAKSGTAGGVTGQTARRFITVTHIAIASLFLLFLFPIMLSDCVKMT